MTTRVEKLQRAVLLARMTDSQVKEAFLNAKRTERKLLVSMSNEEPYTVGEETRYPPRYLYDVLYRAWQMIHAETQVLGKELRRRKEQK